jgi:hypothetical protein
MQLADSPVGEPSPQRRKWLEVTLLSGFILSLFIGLAALSALLALWNNEGSTSDDNPLNGINVARVVPQLALMDLAGEPAEALAYQALNAGELETAHATALFHPKMSGPSRTGLFLQLAGRYLDRSATVAAGHTYRLALGSAILDPSLPLPSVSQTLVHIASGSLGASQEAALDSAIQAVRVASQTPDLLPAQRNQTFVSLQSLARDLEADLLSQQIDEFIRNPYLMPGGHLLDPQLPSLSEPVEFDEPLAMAVAARQQAARRLAERIALTDGMDIEPERQSLTETVLHEDQVRSNFYGRMLSGPISLQQQFWLVQNRRDWIALKARIALGGYGISIVPEWEASLSEILGDLTAATSTLDVVFQGLISAQPTPLDQANLRVETLLWLALQAEMGLYPNAPIADLSSRLVAAQNELADLGNQLALPVAYDADATPPGFRIVSRLP